MQRTSMQLLVLQLEFYYSICKISSALLGTLQKFPPISQMILLSYVQIKLTVSNISETCKINIKRKKLQLN